MPIEVLLALAASGVVVGFVSGLVGIGGGVLIVPLLYFIYGRPELTGVVVPPELEAVLAHATSLFVIVPTSALGVWTYHRAGMVAWRAALPIAAAAVPAAVAASLIAPRLPVPLLKVAFALILLAAGIRLLRGGPTPRPGTRPHPALAAVSGAAVGAVGSLLGIGGGLIAIPILIYLMGLPLERVAATSMAIIVVSAAAGVAGYVAGGLAVPGLPPGSVGFVHVLGGLPILAGSLAGVPLGAVTNQRLDADRLRWLFGALFLLLGFRLAIVNVLALAG